MTDSNIHNHTDPRTADEEDKFAFKDELSTSGSEDEDTQGDHHSSTRDFDIAKYENEMVEYSRTFVMTVIMMVAISMSLITFVVVRNGEEADYQQHFFQVTKEIETVSQLRAQEIFESLETLSTFFTSHVVAANLTRWPFVLLPDFQVHAMLSSNMIGAATLTLHPLVTEANRRGWEQFSQYSYYEWMEESHNYDRKVNPDLYIDERNETMGSDPDKEAERWNVTGISPSIWKPFNGHLSLREPVGAADLYFPEWQRAPASDYEPTTNLDLASQPHIKNALDSMLEADEPVLTRITDASFLLDQYDRRFSESMVMEPHSYLLQPIYDGLEVDRSVVAILSAFFRWGTFFDNVVADNERGLMLILEGSCGQRYTYVLNGYKAEFLGNSDLHDMKYFDVKHKFSVVASMYGNGTDINSTSSSSTGANDTDAQCTYAVSIYPSDQWKATFYTSDPVKYSFAVLFCFFITTIVFVLYDWMVSERQRIVLDAAQRSNRIVSNLFPEAVRDKLLEDAVKNEGDKSGGNDGSSFFRPRKSFTQPENTGVTTSETIFGGSPLAELFPDSTIMFADMAGFTAWSSEREPCQVFTLLETVYHSFDTIAKRRRVFKVETIGDCYVAVCGVPTPNKDHALIMAKFASDCLFKMRQLVHDLETVLGPETSNLTLRVGLHSGPVTAGVLRGDKGRFQLFGDTMNTASRMESTGIKGKIQISAATNERIVQAGKDWTVPREEKVVAKGKGTMSTFWLQLSSKASSSSNVDDAANLSDLSEKPVPVPESAPETVDAAEPKEIVLTDKVRRLVKWNTDILQRRLRHIMVERRERQGRRKSNTMTTADTDGTGGDIDLLAEVTDALRLPRAAGSTAHQDPFSVDLPPNVMDQLEDYITNIAKMYPENPFHNFEHASHVTMSVTKLLSRIENPLEGSPQNVLMDLASHPVTQFSSVLAALIHDAMHPGVPNFVLVNENDPLVAKYTNKSTAEQQSFNVAWNLLMKPEYKELRSCIYTDDDEFTCFRSVMIQLVGATDIMDKDLGAARKVRWAKAFKNELLDMSMGDFSSSTLEEDEKTKYQATVVLEHLIQASDVAHTMQHWHVYRKWNQMLFSEMYRAYKSGRLEKDPSEDWYKGELGFFDFYIIPLAKKLETCGVFGVSSLEYLSYAEANRSEWEQRGESIVQDYLEELNGSSY